MRNEVPILDVKSLREKYRLYLEFPEPEVYLLIAAGRSAQKTVLYFAGALWSRSGLMQRNPSNGFGHTMRCKLEDRQRLERTSQHPPLYLRR